MHCQACLSENEHLEKQKGGSERRTQNISVSGKLLVVGFAFFSLKCWDGDMGL